MSFRAGVGTLCVLLGQIGYTLCPPGLDGVLRFVSSWAGLGTVCVMLSKGSRLDDWAWMGSKGGRHCTVQNTTVGGAYAFIAAWQQFEID